MNLITGIILIAILVGGFALSLIIFKKNSAKGILTKIILFAVLIGVISVSVFKDIPLWGYVIMGGIVGPISYIIYISDNKKIE
ncbi:hypothetical protein KPL47_23195 [Clostridium estertheticum]|uniref:hypothetical protein n=1 Tax=Clostridium TaxID=1485 RepID=UPI001C0AA91C|nr:MULTISPECIES: hypothetical protein [Clostridium]MBU3146941.1 hypothetical protein [Clostridium sp. CF012]MBU3179202.1 hypothetical protein [Clostridium estertheticum]